MVWIIIFIICIIFVLMSMVGRKSKKTDYLTYVVSKSNMIIDVSETGNVDTSDSLQIRSEVEGKTKIISIIPEGVTITEQDVANKKVLVELDSSEIKKRLTQQEITVQSQQASFTDAKSSYEIQKNQNESNQNEGELKVTFAKMELEKYLGKTLSDKFSEKKVKEEELIENPELGGECLQKKRKLENDILLAKEELNRAKVKLEWTKKLYEKGYVTGDDLQSDQLNLKRQEINIEQTETALDLYKKYEFRKDIEKFRSDYEEAIKNLERIIARNASEISKAEVRLKTEEAKLKQHQEELDKLKKQLENCKIIATKPGLVVYAGSNQPWRDEQIKEGADVYERQELINIPNTSAMIVKTKVHESDISRVVKGLKAEITIDALPGKKFNGIVKKVGILPDAQNRWLNPNLKVYMTEVEMVGKQTDLKPGMSAQVKIIIDELKNVLNVPVQAVRAVGDEKVCYVLNSSSAEMKKVKTGSYNDKFIEIKEGLKEGEKVILNASELYEKSKSAIKKKGEKGKEQQPSEENSSEPKNSEQKPSSNQETKSQKQENLNSSKADQQPKGK